MRGSWGWVAFFVTLAAANGYGFFAWHSPMRWMDFGLAFAGAFMALRELNYIQQAEARRAEEQRCRDEREWGHR